MLGVLLGLIAAWALLPVSEWLGAFTSWVAAQGLRGQILFATAYAVATVLVVPGSVLTLAAGVAFGLAGFFVVVAGASVGAIAAFFIARFVAREAVDRRLGHHRLFRAVDGAVGDAGWQTVLLMRLSPLVPFNLQNYLFGITRVSAAHYCVATVFGIMPGTLLYVYLGAIGRALATDAERSPLTWLFFGLGLIATLVVTVIITRRARNRLAAHGVAGEGDEPEGHGKA